MTYLLLFATAFGAQALLFVPIVPLLVATGAMAARGHTAIAAALVSLALGVAAGDFLWYAIGRRRGAAVVGRLCRLALEPSTCVRRGQNLFGRFGAASLLVAKFIPGLSTVVLPLAGVFEMQPRRFVMYDVPGAFLWVSAYVAVGYASAGAFTSVGALAPWAGRGWLLVGAAALAGYLLVKRWRRVRMLEELRGATITVEQLQQRLAAGDPLAIVDLRHPIDFEGDPYLIPGAIYIPAEQLAERHAEIPRDREVVLYCTCPDEITSARAARRLRQQGIASVRPLVGGLSAWRSANLPVERRGSLVPVAARTLNAA